MGHGVPLRWAGLPREESCVFRGSIFAPRAELLEDVRARLGSGRGFAIATLNLDHLVKLRGDQAFREAYRSQSHTTADGHPVVWLEALSGRRIERITGADLVVPLAQVARSQDVAIALVGSTPDSLKGAKQKLEDRVPGLRVVACISPPMGFDPTGCQSDAVHQDLAASGARLCLLALGAPKQEIFAARGRAMMPQMGFASIGAGLDFLSGHQVRAPRILQALAMEWAWRLARDPARFWRRYLVAAVLLPGLAASALRYRMAAPRFPAE